MAKFVLAGRANCPYYAKAELLADYLQKNLPNFQVFKIKKHPDSWEEWLKEVCEENGWNHTNSPIIWRELLDRGGKGLLLGGYNEFLEHAQLYYGVISSMSTEMMMIIAEENLDTCVEEELEKESLKDVTSPLQVWITSATSSVSYNLIPILVSGEVFGMHTQISLTLFDDKVMEECLKSLVFETEDLASPVLHSVSFCTSVEEAFLHAQVVIVLDENTRKEVYTLESYLRSRVPICRFHGYLMEKNAQNCVKVIVGGKTFVNLKAVLLMKYAPSISKNIVAVALGVEGQAKATVARKLKTTASCKEALGDLTSIFMLASLVPYSNGIKDVIVWGNISGNNYIDLRKAKVYNYESAIWGPPQYSQPVLNLIFDSEWVQKEFVETLKNLTDTGKNYGGILAAHSIATTLKYWYHGSPPGEIVSLGVLSEGEFGLPVGIVFSMPVKFENGTWKVLTDLEDVEIDQTLMATMTGDLIQEELVAFGDLEDFKPDRTEEELTQKHEEFLKSIRDGKQGRPKVVDVLEQRSSMYSRDRLKGRDPAKSNDSEDKTKEH